ncbi:MAG: hypothetical protein UC708_02925 [Anaerovoracaceae bacterium]|nr:hypothetical protein [Bacillota bacterium]MEE0516815.1 hypothetical protein [Anaerovoracaceae bacterium]
MFDNNLQQKEIREALQAGQQAIAHLEQARQDLKSASGFGFADMLGLDFIGGIGKHMKINNAAQQLEMAKASVINFQRELYDVQGHLNFHIDLGGFLTFADFFFDGLIADFMVQSKINNTINQIDAALAHIHPIMADLYRMEREI